MTDIDPPHEPKEVRDTYERIAGDFDRTRSSPWPAVQRFVETATSVQNALDIGCGNGRHLELLHTSASRTVGIDISRALLEVSARRQLSGVELIEASASRLPFHDGFAQLVLYIATMHHLPSTNTRVASLDELARVLSDDGEGLVSVWSVTHDRFDTDEAFDTLVDWTLPSGETVPRYYHIYDRPSFDRELSESDLEVIRSWEEAGNLYAHVRSDASQW